MLNQILAILLSLEPSYRDHETWPQRVERMTMIAEAIDEAAAEATCEAPYAADDCAVKWKGSREELSTLLAVNGWVESKYALNVHEGKCRAWECDSIKGPDGKVVFRARTPWQIHQSTYLQTGEWKGMLGASPEATKVAAKVAARILSDSYNVCHTIPGALARYGGAACTWKGVAYRYKVWQQVTRKTSDALQADHSSWEQLLSRPKRTIRIIPATKVSEKATGPKNNG